MTSPTNPDSANRAALPIKRSSSLSSLQPIDAAPFKSSNSGWIVWGSLLFALVISLLPWRHWVPAPDVLLLVLMFWCLHEPRRIGIWVAFVFGLVLDVHDAGLLGEHALSYTLATYGAIALSRRLLLFGPWVQAMHLFPVVVVAMAIPRFLHAWLTGDWAGWEWLWSAGLTTLLWPLADFLFFLPHRRLDEADDGTS